MSSNKQGYRDAFIVMGIVGTFLILIQGFRIAEAQKQAQSPFIQDVVVSFDINVFLEDPAMADYRNRLEEGINKFLSSNQQELGASSQSL